jgi:uncharacterized protein (DUF1697 family)
MRTLPKSQRPARTVDVGKAPGRYVALLRGVNVGTAKRIAMAELRTLFEDLGYENVCTILNSGNVVFTVPGGATGDDHAARMENAIAERLGVRSRVIVLTRTEVAAALADNPLTSAAENPSRLLILAFADPRHMALLAPLRKERWIPEAFAVGTRVAYLWCARGIGVSRLWTMVNRAIGDAATARNVTTMTRILATLDSDTLVPARTRTSRASRSRHPGRRS